MGIPASNQLAAASQHDAWVTQEALRRERDHLQVLVDVTNAVLSTLNIDDLVAQVAPAIHHFFGIDCVSLNIFDSEHKRVQTHSVTFLRRGPQQQQADVAAEALPLRQLLAEDGVFIAPRQQLQRLAALYPRFAVWYEAGVQSLCLLPLGTADRTLGALLLTTSSGDAVFNEHLALLQQLSARISLALDHALAYQEISRLKDKLASENQALTEEISQYANFDQIIGDSPAMAAVLEQVRMVAASDCSVLILGETGTGKELIARMIHQLSARKKQRMVTMNCAAIPSGLLESDLFGHEKGAFTGAAGQRLGRFEMAHQGTLFLDEVGDIPLELQPKLLRVLQEREIERVGGQKVIPVDVRVIAATSCDLKQMMADKLYRSDLYYRLNVFPIVVPPLRERKEDIPQLARFFTSKFARRSNRVIDSIADETLAQLSQHSWPGNVRELQNVIERAVILSRGPNLQLPLADLDYAPPPPTPILVKEKPIAMADFSDSERERIVQVLQDCNGIVAGPKGAAARLGVKRTTLLSRMQRLGISVKSISEM